MRKRFFTGWAIFFGVFTLPFLGRAQAPVPAFGGTPPAIPSDGITDATSAIQAQLNALAMTGGELALPPGQYLIGGHITVPTAVTLHGSWNAPHHGSEWNKGTTLLITGGRDDEKGPGAIRLSADSVLQGVTLLWPQQMWNDIRPYPWGIEALGGHVTVENVTLMNAYQGIGLLKNASLHYIRNVYGFALRRGIFVDQTTDIGRIEDVHFNPHYWLASGHPSASPNPEVPDPDGRKPADVVRKYCTDHLDAFIFARTDWEYVSNTFVWGAVHGYLFIQSDHGACNGQFMGIGADFCKACVEVDSIQPIGLQITNGEFTAFAGEPNSAVVTAPGAGGAVQLVNCNFWGVHNHAAWLQGETQVTLSACHICRDGGDVLAEHGRLIVQGCFFDTSDKDRSKTAITLNPKVEAAAITGNLRQGGLTVNNQIGARAQIGLNESP